jgi:CubicO group peptidase (beta-lactamase class C family)
MKTSRPSPKGRVDPAAATDRRFARKADAAPISMRYPPTWLPVQERRGQAEARRVLWQTFGMLESGIASKLFPGVQLYVSVDGKPIASFGIGYARDGYEVLAETLFPWFCIIKPIIAVAFAQLWEKGLVSIDDRVADVIPEFAKNGKEAITYRHILTHTAGLKKDPVRPLRFEPRSVVLDEIYNTRLDPGSAPGFSVKYGVFWGWAILCETIERLTGDTYDQYMQKNLLEPAGITDFWPQMPYQLVEKHLGRLGLLFDLNGPEPRPWPAKSRLDHYDKDQPATSLIATAASVGKVYEAMSDNRWLTAMTTTAMTAKHRVGIYDENFRGFVSFGLGTVVDGRYFGSYCSPRTFGHKGLNSSCALVDPEYRLVLAFIVNGLINTEVSDARDQLIIDSVYRDLGFGEGRPPAPKITSVESNRSITDKPALIKNPTREN